MQGQGSRDSVTRVHPTSPALGTSSVHLESQEGTFRSLSPQLCCFPVAHTGESTSGSPRGWVAIPVCKFELLLIHAGGALFIAASALPPCSAPAQGCGWGTPITRARCWLRPPLKVMLVSGQERPGLPRRRHLALRPGSALRPSAARTVLVLGKTRGCDMIRRIYQPDPGSPSPPSHLLSPPRAVHAIGVQPHISKLFFPKILSLAIIFG